jgi:hypothetical protein
MDQEPEHSLCEVEAEVMGMLHLNARHRLGAIARISVDNTDEIARFQMEVDEAPSVLNPRQQKVTLVLGEGVERKNRQRACVSKGAHDVRKNS